MIAVSSTRESEESGRAEGPATGLYSDIAPQLPDRGRNSHDGFGHRVRLPVTGISRLDLD